MEIFLEVLSCTKKALLSFQEKAFSIHFIVCSVQSLASSTSDEFLISDVLYDESDDIIQTDFQDNGALYLK